MKRIGGLGIGGIVWLLSACGSSPPLRYYALQPVAPVSAVPAPGGTALIRVRHVGLPPEMDHRGLTHQVGATQLAVADNDQWSAPLSDLIQSTLTRDLGERLGFEHVMAPAALPVPGKSDAQATALDVDFVMLMADEGCAVSAQVNWVLTPVSGPSRHGSVHAAGPASAACPAGLPAALSASLGDLADQLTRLIP